MSPDCRRIATGGEDGLLRICDATAFDPEPLFVDDAAALLGLNFDSPNDRLMAFGAVSAVLRLWDLSDFKTIHSELGAEKPNAVCGTPDGRLWAVVRGKSLQVRRARIKVKSGRANCRRRR